MMKNKLTFVCDTVIATCLRSTDIMIPARAKMLLRVFFYGRKAHEGKNNTRLLFNSNLHGNICCFARQKGLFSNYGKDFKNNGRQVNLPVTERLEFLKMLRHDIYHLGMGIDIDDDRFGNTPSGVALKFRYANLRHKADSVATKLKKAIITGKTERLTIRRLLR